MINKEIFSWSRFLLVCKKDMMENWKSMVLRFIMVYALMASVVCFICYWDCDGIMAGYKSILTTQPKEYVLTGLFVFAGMSLVFSSFMMENMQSKTKRISYLMSPSSIFEKFIERFLLVVVVYPLFFVFAFKLADLSRYFIFSIFYPSYNFSLVGFDAFYGVSGIALFNNLLDLACATSVYLFVQSLFILASTLWYRKVAVKTVACLVALYMIFFIVDGTLIHLLFKSGINDFYSALRFVMEFADDHMWEKINTVIYLVLTLFVWVLSYFRFKESEIINRL